MPYDVFLSHNARDKPVVRSLAERLREAGLQVWFDEWAIKPGDDIYLAIERGLQESRAQVLCLSAEALRSNWVDLERSTVLFRDPANIGRRFIPLLLTDCDLPDTLRRYKYVDYRTQSDSAFDELLAVCRPVAQPEEASGERILRKRPRRRPTAARRAGDAPAKASEVPSLGILERTLIGHKGWIWSLAVAPDGSWVASGSDDETVKIWDLASGECTSTFNPNCGKIFRVVIAPDGRLVIGGEKEVVVWDPGAKRASLRLKAHDGQVTGLVAFEGGARLLSGGFDQELKLWDMTKGVCLKTISVGTKEEDEVFCASRGRVAGEAITGHRDGTVRLWDLAVGKCLKNLTGHNGAVLALSIMPDERHVISGSLDRAIRICDLRTANCVGVLEGHREHVDDIAISPNGSVIASTGFIDHTIRLWDWRNGVCVGVIESDKTPLSVGFTPDGARLVVGTTDDLLEVYRLDESLDASPRVNSRRYVNAKVVLVGQSGVGKTTLAHRLVEDRYVATDSTHGMNVWPLALPLPSHDALEREALLWDLAGQEDYRLTHQLFLHDTSLALLLINPQADDPFVEAVDWIKALRTAAKLAGKEEEVVKLLISSRIDVGGLIVSQVKVDRFLSEHQFSDYLATSAKRGDNCSDSANGGKPSALKQLIARHIPWERLAWTSTHYVLAELKNATMRMRDSEDIRLIRFAELSQRLEQALPGEVFGENDVRTAVTLLANQGLARALKFGDLVLLRPDLLNGYAGAIIRAARAHKDEIGCVAEEDIFSDNFDFTGIDRLRRADEELLLRGLIQTLLDHALCIREQEGGQILLIFPSQYRRDRELPSHPNIFVTYSFSGELQTIYTTLVVRLWHGGTFGQKELWRNAAEFTTSKGDTVGLLFERLGDGEGRLSVFFDPAVPDELKVVFIEFVHRHLARYGQNLMRERRYVCQHCGTAITDMAAIQKRMAAGRAFIMCQYCDKRVVFKDHIEDRLGSHPVLTEVIELDRRATRELDNQAREQILLGHMMAICGEANQIFRELARPDCGIDGEVEFRSVDGEASGKKI
jgi:WD40 repeat protein